MYITSSMNFPPQIFVLTYTKMYDLLFNSYSKTASESTLNAATYEKLLSKANQLKMSNLWVALYLAMIPSQIGGIHQ